MKNRNQKKGKNGKLYRIFIVEDSDTTRTLLERYLQRLPRCKQEYKPDYEIHAFESGEECLRHLHLRPDIVILDYYLDDHNNRAMNGLTLLREIRKALPSVHVIAMSGQQEVITVAELFRSGIRDYVSKEHACHVRVEEAVLGIFEEERHTVKRRKLALQTAILSFITGLALGLWLL